MSINVHHKGDLVRISGAFTDIAGAAVDPATVSLKVVDPAGVETEYTYAGATVIKAATGSYYKDLDANQAGEWHYWWESTGSGQGAEPGQFVVEPTLF